MKFYWYNQNNSGGSFHFDKDDGITNHVIIEAENIESANSKFFEIGGYFNGVDDDIDCGCCGDRWRFPEEEEKPLIYSESPQEFVKTSTKWVSAGKEVCIHYANGKKEWY